MCVPASASACTAQNAERVANFYLKQESYEILREESCGDCFLLWVSLDLRRTGRAGRPSSGRPGSRPRSTSSPTSPAAAPPPSHNPPPPDSSPSHLLSP